MSAFRTAIILFLCGFANVPRLGAQDAPIILDDLVVTAHRSAVPITSVAANVTVLEGENLEAAGYVSVVDALRSVPGVSVVQSGSFGSVASVFMRGGESDYVGVLIDGVQVNEPGGRFDFAHLPVHQIERIEIVRGPVSTMYGSDAVTGVIQIFTRTGTGSPTVMGSMSGGTFGSVRGSASLEGAGSRASYGVSVTGFTSDGTLDYNNGYDNLSLRARTRLALDQTSLSLSARLTDHTFHFPTDGSGQLVDENSASFGDGLTVGIEARHRVSDRLEVAALLTMLDSESGLDDTPDGPADSLGFFGYQSTDDLGRRAVDLRTSMDLSAFGTVSVGFEAEEQSLSSTSQSQSEFGPSTDSSDESRSNTAVYAQWLGRWNGLSGNVSLRRENNRSFGEFWTHTAGAAYYVAHSGTKIRGMVGRGIKEPTMFENFASGFTAGNPDLRPEESSSWEVGIDQAILNDRVQVSATYFDQTFVDLIQYTFAPPMPGDPNYYNVGGAVSRGLELEAGAALGSVSLTLGYQWVDAEVTDAGFDVGPDATFVEGERLLRRPVSELSLGAVAGLGQRVRTGVEVRWVGDRIDRDFSVFPAARVTLPAYTVVDIHGELAIRERSGGSPGFSLLFRGENMLGEDYSEVQGFPARGRTLWVGGRLRIGGD